MAEALQVRVATPADAPEITEIYNQGIADRVGTFETDPRTPADIERWFDGAHPIVVATLAGIIVAFASTSSYRPRACYARNAEFSVYVRRDMRGHGAGRLVMQGLVEAAASAGFVKLISRVFVENGASRTMLAKLGFREVGIYEKHGQLEGIWRDVVIVELLIPENL
jgi:L-amino acid N-acyltransferase YncA